MKPVFLFVLAAALARLAAQQPLSPSQALSQLYHGFNQATNTARWDCTPGQKARNAHAGWPCTPDYATVSVSVLLHAQVPEGNRIKTYLVSSAKPTGTSMEFDCHACQPSIGVAVFALEGQNWVLESANPAIDFYGGWGNAPEVSLVQVGPEKHGIILSWSDMGQGFESASKSLLIPAGKTVSNVWDLGDEEDNLGAIDPTEKSTNFPPHRFSAAFRFLSGDESTNSNGNPDYYDIEVIARGDNRDSLGRPAKSQNWTAIYRFANGKYRLFKRTQFNETLLKK